MIKRDRYLNMLIRKKGNGLVKVITGIRRCGKSYLLFEIYHQYLNSIGVEDEQIIEIALDDELNFRYRNPLELSAYIRTRLTEKDKNYYIFLDEIQKVASIKNPYLDDENEKIGFVDVVLGLMKINNVDIYITGSNSKMLSSDILTEFRGRGDEIRVNPLSFSEFCSAYDGSKQSAWKDYYTYGGMPLILAQKTHEDKSKYLSDLFDRIYIDDIISRNNLSKDKVVLETLLNVISSAVGSLTNPSRIADTFISEAKIKISPQTISSYMDCFVDSFLIYSAQRYNVKGRKYIGSPFKYYYSDIGLRNARLNFRQQEENHIMENIIFNELCYRGYNVDVGVLEYNYKNENDKSARKQLEIDFVANRGNKRYYIQSALHIDSAQKMEQETNSLKRIDDSFKKIVVVKDDIIPWYDDNGIMYIGIIQFLLDDTGIDFL